MKTFTGILPNGEAIAFVDGKRYLWALSLLFSLQPLFAAWLHSIYGATWLLFLPLLLTFGLGPIIDALVGEDRDNPPEEVVAQLGRDPYYRYLTYAAVPLHLVTLFGATFYAATAGLGVIGFTGLALATGMASGLAINTGHELGHKNSRLEKWLAKLSLAVPFYGHFAIDHNLGHHRNVSTPGDPASARMGESIYRFALREIPGAFREAWIIERDRLRRRGRSAWHPNNQILQSYAISLGITIGLVLWVGWLALPFLLIHHVLAYWQLTSANYVEHYGLLRSRGADGRFERCAPRHSWNSNHVFSNVLLFHLERHSDHHANPLRRYQALRHFDDAPQLPNGYFGVYLLAYLPWLWFRVMDKRLLALPHVEGDLDKVNICPEARAALFLKYGRDKMIEPA